MSLYELEGIPKAYSTQAQEVQKGREAKIQHLLLHVSSRYLWFYEYPWNIYVRDSASVDVFRL